MNRFLTQLLGVLLLALGLMAGAALFFLLLFVAAAVWLVFKARQLWGRMTGKPVRTPWSVGRFDPRDGFKRAYGSVSRPTQPAGQRQQLDDVTDVTPKQPPQHD